MASKKKPGKFNKMSVAKKDTNGLFVGMFKSEEFATVDEKNERRRKSTQDYLEEIEEEFEDA